MATDMMSKSPKTVLSEMTSHKNFHFMKIKKAQEKQEVVSSLCKQENLSKESSDVEKCGESSDVPTLHYKCLVCGLELSDVTSFMTHAMAHTEEGLFDCDVCGKRFYKQLLLNRHRTSSHGKEENSCKYRCDHCNKSFRDRYTLDRHKQRLKGQYGLDQRRKCEVCDKEMSSIQTLRRHMMIHTGDTPYPCTVCGKSFNQKATVAKHMRIHTGEQPFSCKYCGRDFAASGSMLRHIRRAHESLKRKIRRKKKIHDENPTC